MTAPTIAALSQQEHDQAMLAAANPEDKPCEHDWVDIRNSVVQSGEWCSKCNAVRPTPSEDKT
jgi:hypothetical protein